MIQFARLHNQVTEHASVFVVLGLMFTYWLLYVLWIIIFVNRIDLAAQMSFVSLYIEKLMHHAIELQPTTTFLFAWKYYNTIYFTVVKPPGKWH